MQLLPPTTKSENTECARSVLDTAPSLIWYIRLHMRKHRQGLSVPQFRALVKVRNGSFVSLSMVADHLGASLPTTSRIVAKLVDKGYLARCESPNDRRQIVLQLTGAGRELVDTAAASTQAQMESQLSQLTPSQWTQVRNGMGILKSLLEAAGYPGAANEGTIVKMDASVPSQLHRNHRQTAQL